MLSTHRQIFSMKNCAQQQTRAQSNMHIPKWKYLPNWDIIIQTHPLQFIPPHLPWVVDKGPIYAINYPEPQYIYISCPKMPPDICKSTKQWAGILGTVITMFSILLTLVYRLAQQCCSPVLPSGTLGKWTTLPILPKDPTHTPKRPYD
jgi:hypothetical protein